LTRGAHRHFRGGQGVSVNVREGKVDERESDLAGPDVVALQRGHRLEREVATVRALKVRHHVHRDGGIRAPFGSCGNPGGLGGSKRDQDLRPKQQGTDDPAHWRSLQGHGRSAIAGWHYHSDCSAMALLVLGFSASWSPSLSR